MRNTLLLFAILFCTCQLKAQDTLTGRCWTPEMDTTEFQNQPWYSNNDFLENFLDSIGYPAAGLSNRIVGSPTVRYWIPIKFWIYRDDNGNGGPTLAHLQLLMDDLNRRFNQANNAWIGFYMKCDPSYINNSTHLIKTFTGASLLMAANNDLGSINVHLIQSFSSSTAGFSIPFLNAAMVPTGAYTDPSANSDLSHEVGHVLGLSHTHQYSAWDWKCLTECVSRTRTWPTFNLCPTRIISNKVCEATGDGLRDTPADDNLVLNGRCYYNVSFGNDPWGDSYDNPPGGLQDQPDFRNIMSYNSAPDCIDRFSRLQIGVMLWTILSKKPNNYPGWGNPITTFDSYEPDNSPEMTVSSTRHIQLNEIQERNFHQQWNRDGGIGHISQCDVDWVRFEAPCSGNFDILTASIPRRTTVNTRLTLYDQNLNQVAQNDNISAFNLYSNIIQSLTGGQTYFIKVENLSPNTTGYYTLRIIKQGVNPAAFQISGADVLCVTNESYVVNGLPLGSSVSWSANPSGIVNISPTVGNPTTLSKVANGNVTLTAEVGGYCGSTTFNINKNITVGAQSISIIGPYDPVQHTIMGVVCQGKQYYFIAGDSEPMQTYTWTVFPPPGSIDLPAMYSGSTVYLTFSELGYYTLRVSKTNSCGTTFTDVVLHVQECMSGFGLRTSPNPTKATISVTIENETKLVSASKDVKVELFNFYTGERKRQWSFGNNQKQFNLNVSGLAKGIYILKITKGKHQQSSKVMIE